MQIALALCVLIALAVWAVEGTPHYRDYDDDWGGCG